MSAAQQATATGPAPVGGRAVRASAARGRVVCAVVDAYSTGRFLPAELARLGAGVLHVRSTPEVPAHLRDVAATLAPSDTIVHEGDLVRTADRLRRRGVTHVVPGAECGVDLAAALAARLGLPGAPPDGASSPVPGAPPPVPGASPWRDKAQMVARVAAAGLAAPASAVVDRPEQLAAWLDAHGRWPVVVKPVDSAGADNVRVCGDRDGALVALERVLSARNMVGRANRRALVQEFLDGEELFANTVSRAGVHHVAEVWRYVKRRLPDGPVVYDYEEPLPPADPRVPVTARYVTGVLDALGITDGAAHTEVMLTGRGPVLIETGARLAGAVLPPVVTRCFGTSQVRLLAAAVAAPDEFLALAGHPYRVREHLRWVWLIRPRDGAAPAPGALDRVRALPTVAAVTVPAADGRPLRRTTDSASCPGHVYLAGAPDQVEQDYQQLRDWEQDGLYEY